MTSTQKRILALHAKHFRVSEIAERARCSKSMVRVTLKNEGRLVGTSPVPPVKRDPKKEIKNPPPEDKLSHILAKEPANDGDEEMKKKLAETLRAKINYHLRSAKEIEQALEVLEKTGVL